MILSENGAVTCDSLLIMLVFDWASIKRMHCTTVSLRVCRQILVLPGPDETLARNLEVPFAIFYLVFIFEMHVAFLLASTG